MQLYLIIMLCCPSAPPPASVGKTHQTKGYTYLSKLRRDSVGADFQSVRKLTNYVCAKPPELRLSVFRNTYRQTQQYPRYGGCRY